MNAHFLLLTDDQGRKVAVNTTQIDQIFDWGNGRTVIRTVAGSHGREIWTRTPFDDIMLCVEKTNVVTMAATIRKCEAEAAKYDVTIKWTPGAPGEVL